MKNRKLKQIIFSSVIGIAIIICIIEAAFYYFELKDIVSSHLLLIGNHFDVILIVGGSLGVVIWNILIFKK